MEQNRSFQTSINKRLIFDKDDTAEQWEEDVLPSKGNWDKWKSTWKETKLGAASNNRISVQVTADVKAKAKQ